MTLSVFIPLQKADIAKREVWGVAAVEQPDQAREIMDYEKSKPHFLAWSERIKKASGGKSLGNVRDSHTVNAIGKVIALEADDAAKAFRVGVKVVDDNAWQKVTEGVFTGFSIGGAYGERWRDGMNKALTRYEAKPSEISLVDVPCIPGATFEVVKADGSVMTKAFPPQDEKEEDTKEETPPAEGEQNSDQSAVTSNQSKSEQAQGDEPKDEGSEQPAEAEESAEGETREEPAQGMNAESVKQVVIQLLLELGLVQESGGAFKAAKDNAEVRMMKAEFGNKSAELQKAFDGFKTSIVADIAKIVNAVGVLEKRGAGPVLREVAPLTAQKQADTQRADLLKQMAKETPDPNIKQALMLEASRLEIRQIQNS